MMKIHLHRFNIYLTAALVLVVLSGCQTPESKRKNVLATFRLYQEVNRDPAGHSQEVPIYRAHPYKLTIADAPFLGEGNVKAAKVVDVLGGFALQIEFDRRGTWLFEQYTAGSRGKHIGVFSQFVEPNEEELNEGRWLAAPLMQAPITNGVFIFTPDATRQEAEAVALGLNNVAKKLATGKEPRFD